MAQHKHFELMALFAEDARVSETPWQFWQSRPIKPDGCKWTDFAGSPMWQTDYEYRRKPRTIRIGEFDVPEPMRAAPDVDSTYYVPQVGSNRMYDEWYWNGDVFDLHRLNSGVCHATKEAATAHCKALMSFTEAKS